MNNYLATTLKGYLERAGRSNLDLERAAGLPGATVARLFDGRHPRQDTMAAILSAVPRDVARELLLAYLKDDCPDEWEDRIKLDLLDTSITEDGPSYQVGKPRRTDIETALAALTRACEGDIDLRNWVIDTCRVLKLT